MIWTFSTNKDNKIFRTVIILISMVLLLVGCQSTETAEVDVIDANRGIGKIEIIDPAGFSQLDEEARQAYFEQMDQIMVTPGSEQSTDQVSQLEYLTDESAYSEWLASTDEGLKILYIGFQACPYCQALLPKLNQLAFEADLPIYGIDTVEWKGNEQTAGALQQLMEDFQISTVPQVFLIQSGEIIGHVDSSATMAELERFIEFAHTGGQ